MHSTQTIILNTSENRRNDTISHNNMIDMMRRDWCVILRDI